MDKLDRAKAIKERAPRRQSVKRQDNSEKASKSAKREAERGFRFEDPYWDDAFCSYYDPTLRTCCGR